MSNKNNLLKKKAGRKTGGCSSRGQAIVDSLLVDVSRQLREADFPLTGAMSFAAWYQGVALPSAANIFQDKSGLLWGVLKKLLLDARFTRWSEMTFSLVVVHHKACQQEIKLKAVCHPGDDNESVITILLAKERSNWI